METKEFLDRQVEAMRERKEAEKAKEYRLAARVHADVQAFEDSKREHKITHQTKMNQHLDGLMRQIEEQKHIPKKAPHVAKIGMPSLADQELLINRRLIEDAQGEASASPDKVPTIKRPF